MDTIDREILRQLQSNGRATNIELAREIGLSPTPTLRRVRALETSGAIEGYRAILNPVAVGRSFQVLVSLSLSDATQESILELERALIDIPDIVEAHRLYGDPDYLLHVAVADSASYEALYTSKLCSLPGVRRAHSQMIMKTVRDGSVLPVT